MDEYKGVKYKKLNHGSWQIVWPSGLRVVLAALDEAKLKVAIDQALAMASNG